MFNPLSADKSGIIWHHNTSRSQARCANRQYKRGLVCRWHTGWQITVELSESRGCRLNPSSSSSVFILSDRVWHHQQSAVRAGDHVSFKSENRYVSLSSVRFLFYCNNLLLVINDAAAGDILKLMLSNFNFS